MPAYTGFKAEHLGRYGDPSQTAQSAHFLAQMEMGGDRKFNPGFEKNWNKVACQWIPNGAKRA